MISQVPFTPFNMVCTSVPGPQFPLYLLGHKMLHWYPYVPIGGEMAVNCAILSYNGMVYFGFSGDVHAAPDLWRLEKFVKQSFAELRDASGATAPRKKVGAEETGKHEKACVETGSASGNRGSCTHSTYGCSLLIRINSSTGHGKGESSDPTDRLGLLGWRV